MKIGDFLKIKARPAITIAPDETIAAAIQKLTENDIGALPVCNEEGLLLGIISERDLLRECHQRTNAIGSTRVEDVMTRQVAVGTPEDDLDYVTSIMKQKSIRHLPIIVGQKLEGIVSMRDVVGFQLEETKAQIRYAGILSGRAPSGKRRLF